MFLDAWLGDDAVRSEWELSSFFGVLQCLNCIFFLRTQVNFLSQNLCLQKTLWVWVWVF